MMMSHGEEEEIEGEGERDERVTRSERVGVGEGQKGARP
jgi:hypothetical protein